MSKGPVCVKYKISCELGWFLFVCRAIVLCYPEQWVLCVWW